ncbi:hypothetical protein F5Y15DRAFT_252839 [Xylariaceae sp. FL0016]|nr:hypothetical protein F5Y15DRAFT_252839 [Xylariaceae sp. FL0016]
MYVYVSAYSILFEKAGVMYWKAMHGMYFSAVPTCIELPALTTSRGTPIAAVWHRSGFRPRSSGMPSRPAQVLMHFSQSTSPTSGCGIFPDGSSLRTHGVWTSWQARDGDDLLHGWLVTRLLPGMHLQTPATLSQRHTRYSIPPRACSWCLPRSVTARRKGQGDRAWDAVECRYVMASAMDTTLQLLRNADAPLRAAFNFPPCIPSSPRLFLKLETGLPMTHRHSVQSVLGSRMKRPLRS